MSEQGPHTRSGEDAHSDLPPRMPRWVKVSAIVVGVLILLFLVLQLTGIGGQHGPGRHVTGHGALLESVTNDRTVVASSVR